MEAAPALTPAAKLATAPKSKALLEAAFSGAPYLAALAQREFGGVKAEVVFETSTKATNPRWFEIPRQVEPPVEVAKPQPVAAEGRQRPVRRTPSGSEKSVVTRTKDHRKFAGITRPAPRAGAATAPAAAPISGDVCDGSAMARPYH